MKIDKSRFDAAELEQWHALIAKGMVDPEAGEEEMEEDKPPFPPKKSFPPKEPFPPKPTEKADPEGEWYEEEDDDEMEKKCKTNKSSSPALTAALERLANLEKSAEMKECHDIAKKYAALGEDEAELAKTIYEMKKSNDTNYNAYIKALDQSLDIVEKSGLFAEIGKSARGGVGGSAVDKIEAAATELQKSDPTMSRADAIAKSWDNHPELMAEYDAEYNA